jgi:hypothetical protein
VKHHVFCFRIIRVSLLALTLAIPGWCGSTINSYSGDIGFISAPPSSLVPGAVESDLKALLFMEQSDTLFASAITVDATRAGIYNTKASLTPGTIAAGTIMSDFYLHADPITSGTSFTGAVTFNSNILGVIATGPGLFATDAFLGADDIVYRSSKGTRGGFELSATQDQFAISSDLRTLTFSVKTWGLTDDLRILTQGSLPSTTGAVTPVPEPGALNLFALGLGFIAIGARRNGSTRAGVQRETQKRYRVAVRCRSLSGLRTTYSA